MLNVLLTSALALAAVSLLFYLVGLLLRAARVPLDGFWERWRFTWCVTHARRGDALRERGDLDGALRAFEAAFFLSAVRNRGLASTVANHHTGLLSRLIAITEDVQGGTVRLLSLAKVDRLLSERSELQRRYLGNAGVAHWRRRREVGCQLGQNRHELRAALRQLIAEIHASRQPARMQ